MFATAVILMFRFIGKFVFNAYVPTKTKNSCSYNVIIIS